MKKVVIGLLCLAVLIYFANDYYNKKKLEKLDTLSFGVREGSGIHFKESTKNPDIVSKWKDFFENAHRQSQPITLKDKPTQYIMLNSESKGIGYAFVEIHYIDNDVYLVEDSSQQPFWYIKMPKEEFDSLPRP
ncbi:MAG: hypothetical protein ACI35O_15150 [Bacillaceae bacterium]